MTTTLAELVQSKTKEEMRSLLLLALQGIGFVQKTGAGSGTMTLSGVAEDSLDVVVSISVPGELGAAEFDVSWDGGETFTDTGLLTAAEVDIGNGVTLLFANGPAGDSFLEGDTFSFSIAVPTLQATAWQPGSVPLSLVEMDAEATADLSELRAKIAAGGFLTTAEDAWLDLWLDSMYQLTRRAGTPTKGIVKLSDPAGAGPFVVAPGDIWVGTADDLRFVSTTGGTLAQYGGRGQGGDPPALSLTVQADRIGTEHNVGGGAINVMYTPLPGVTVANPNPGGGSWITEAGTDRETNEEARIRAQARWPSLGVGTPNDAYDLWAKSAPGGESVTRTLVRNSPTVPGEVEVFLAGGAGSVDAGVVSAVDDYIQPRVALTSTAVVQSADDFPYTVSGTLYVKLGYAAAAISALAKNLAALNGGGLNTAREQLPGIAIGGVIYRSAIIEEVMRSPGARNFDMDDLVGANADGDLELDETEVAVLTASAGTVEPVDILVVEVP